MVVKDVKNKVSEFDIWRACFKNIWGWAMCEPIAYMYARVSVCLCVSGESSWLWFQKPRVYITGV